MQKHMTLSTDRVDHVNGAWTSTVGGNECVYEYENYHYNNNNYCFISDSGTLCFPLPPFFLLLKHLIPGHSSIHSFVRLVALTQYHDCVISYQRKQRTLSQREEKKRHNLLYFQAKLLWQWKMVSSLEYCQTKELLIKVHTRPCGV